MALRTLSNAVHVSKGADEGRRLTYRTQELLIGAGVTMVQVFLIPFHHSPDLHQQATILSLHQVPDSVQLGSVNEVLSRPESKEHPVPQGPGTLHKVSLVEDYLLPQFPQLTHHTHTVEEEGV